MKEKSVVTEGYVLKNKIYKYMTAIWKNEKNVHIDKLNGRFDKCNSAYHITTKRKPIGVKWITNMTLMLKEMLKIPNLNLMIMLEYQNIKSIFVFVIRKVENTLPWSCIISDLNDEEIVETVWTIYEK